MCLVVVAFNVQDNYPLVVAANRDEFHARPTQNAGWWPDQPDIARGALPQLLISETPKPVAVSCAHAAIW